MSFDEKENAQVEAALRNFRASVKGWSDAELGKGRAALPEFESRRGWSFWKMQSPVAAWGLAAAMLVASVSVPVGLYEHGQSVKAANEAALSEQKKQADEAQKLQAQLAVSDEELLSHVDSDISQSAPDALEPLASLMVDATATAKR